MTRKKGAYLCRGCLQVFVGDPKRTLCPSCEIHGGISEERRVIAVDTWPPPKSLDNWRAAICKLIAQRGRSS
jgi:hypothetical protein